MVTLPPCSYADFWQYLSTSAILGDAAMKGVKEYYCWFKVVQVAHGKGAAALDAAGDDVAKPAPAPESSGKLKRLQVAFGSAQAAVESEARSGGIPMAGGRPPGVPSMSPAPQLGRPVPANGPRPPGMYGGALMAGWWGLDPSFSGALGSDTRVAMMPCIGTRDDAIAWLDSGQGRTWVEGSMTYFLLCFTAAVDA
jgi:hypothetical protein